MRTKPSAIIATASGNARRWANSRLAEQIRKILMQEQDHQIDLATALGIEVPDTNKRVDGKRHAQAAQHRGDAGAPKVR